MFPLWIRLNRFNVLFEKENTLSQEGNRDSTIFTVCRPGWGANLSPHPKASQRVPSKNICLWKEVWPEMAVDFSVGYGGCSGNLSGRVFGKALKGSVGRPLANPQHLGDGGPRVAGGTEATYSLGV